jgi:putative DNA methylase
VKAFIEEQFPVSLISKESYKERMGGATQTLTCLGNWKGRKPLILVRAVILGLLMPASDNAHKDREIFLKILTMDTEGLWQRRQKWETYLLEAVQFLLKPRVWDVKPMVRISTP